MRRDGPAIDTDTNVERELALVLNLHGKADEHRIRAMGRALERHAEQGHDTIAVGLVHVASVALDDLAGAGK